MILQLEEMHPVIDERHEESLRVDVVEGRRFGYVHFDAQLEWLVRCCAAHVPQTILMYINCFEDSTRHS